MTKKMSKPDKAMLIAVIIIAILSGGFFATRQGFKPFATDLIAPSDYFLIPVFGYLKCDRTTCPTQSQMMSGKYAQLSMSNPLTATPYKCQDFIGLNDGCQITLQTTNGNIDSYFHSVQQLTYQLVPEGTPFNENQGTTLSGGVAGYDDGERVTLPLRPNDVIWVRFTEGLGSISSSHVKKNDKVKFVVNGQCFTLYDYNDRNFQNGQPIAQVITGDCLLRDDAYKNRKIISADPIFKLNSQELDWVNLNFPFRVYTYLKGTQPVPFTDGNTQTLNNQFVFCEKSSHRLYKIAQITSFGRTYNSVILDSSGIVGSVNCCEGETQPNKVCRNGQWQTISDSYCDLNKGVFCREADWTSYGTKQVRRFSCVNNQCVPEIKNVECNFNEDCGAGKVCQKGYIPTENKCVGIGTGDICGDNICSNAEYKSASCLKDCPKPPQTTICKSCFGWLWNKMTGNKYCTPQPAKKVLGFIPIPLTSQNKVCPLFLLILLALLIFGGVWGYTIYRKKKSKKRKR